MDGVQDEILTDLARIADLKVISRTSVMQYKSGITRNLREIGQQLGVAHLLEGSVQRSANRIRVNAQLIDAGNDAHLWAQTYDRDLADVFAIQSEIAKAIADQLQAKISPGEKVAIAQVPTTDLTANALYVEARELEFKAPEQQSLLQAVHLLDEAVARDPHFMVAYCMLGRLHVELYWGGYDHPPRVVSSQIRRFRMRFGSSRTRAKSTLPWPGMLTRDFGTMIALAPNWISLGARSRTTPTFTMSRLSLIVVRVAG